MKRLVRSGTLSALSVLCLLQSWGQCLTGWNSASVNWDHLDYLTRLGTYSSFVTNPMRDTQYFTIGVNRVKIQLNGMATSGENVLNTAEAGSFGAGADVEFNGLGTIRLTFDTVVQNLQFSLYDIDLSQAVSITAAGDAAAPLTIGMTAVAGGILTVAGSGTTNPVATANGTAATNADVRGTLNVTIAGGVNGVSTVTITFSGASGNCWLSDLTACVYGSFPLNYYISQKPFAGQPAYYLVTPDNNSVYLFNPLTGVADWLFSEPGSPWVNSMAYDHVHKVLYYVMDNPTPVSSNRSLKKYDFNTESISTVIADLGALGIPLFDIVVESAGAAFYNGSLFLGVEGTNNAKNSARESIIWRIDFDAALQPVQAAQVFARPADNGAGTLTHDWGDFTIKDGTLYDFNTGNVGSTSQFVHFNMQNGNAVFYNTNGSPAPIQAGQTWNGTLYWTGGQSPEGGRVAVYNENGTIGPKITATATACSPAWVGRAGDASDPFRPKSDFGDAPDSYDPVPDDKATHEFNCNLRLGPTYDREWDKTASATATADGSDEDGITTVSILPRGMVTFVQDVRVFNNTGGSATVAAWLDWNGNGAFDSIEGVTRTVASSAAMQTITLAWPGIPVSLPLGTRTFLRVRVTSTSNNMTVNTPTRWFANGEVEDYPVIVDVILPTEMKNFTAKAESGVRVKLDWSTGKEINCDGFELERSADGFSWKSLAFVAANANGAAQNHYLQYDELPLQGLSYYRLKLVSPGGGFQYSAVRTVDIPQLNASLKVIPNPATSKAYITFSGSRSEMASVQVTDMNGRTVVNQSFASSAGMNKIPLSGIDKLAPGTYAVRVVTAGGAMNAKLTVQ